MRRIDLVIVLVLTEPLLIPQLNNAFDISRFLTS